MITYILTGASLITALGVIGGLIFKMYKWCLRQEKQDEEIRPLKEEDTLICYALSAFLDALNIDASCTLKNAGQKLLHHPFPFRIENT